VYPGQTDGQIVLLSQISGCRQIALLKQNKHLHGRNIRYQMHEIMPLYKPVSLS
jgi:hypothetical protein